MILKFAKPFRGLIVAGLLLALAAGGRAQQAGGNVRDLNAKGEPVAAPAAGAAGDAPVRSATMGQLRQIESANKDVKTIHATFDQIRVDEAFQEEVKSPGELWFAKPAQYRCDYAEPQKMVTLITGDTLYMYLPKEKQVEYWKFASAEERDQQLHQLLIVFGFNADELAARYEIRSSEDTPELKAQLTAEKLDPARKLIFQVRPRPASEESCPFKQMKVTIDKSSHLPDKIWYKDPSDAALTLKMKKVELNPTLPAGVFDKNALFPSGVEYIDKRNAR
jgi:outer membrane lipoprotein-sorting protein